MSENKSPTFPTISFAGSAAANLVGDAKKAYLAIKLAIEAMEPPHGRDYSPEGYARARKEYEERITQMKLIQSFYSATAKSIQQQEKARGRKPVSEDLDIGDGE